MSGSTDLQVRSEMPGLIVLVAVEAGASVAEGDELVVMESMKMEIPVEAPRGGTVREIHVAAGDRVNEDDLLVTIRR